MRFFLVTASVGLAATLAAAILVSPTGAQGQGAGPKFKQGALPSEGNTQYEMIVSEDKKAALIALGLETQLDGIGAPLFATRVFSVSVPLTGAEKGVKLGVFLEGAVVRQKGTDISLITTVNGRTHFMDFAKFPLASGEPISDGECAKFGPAEGRGALKRKSGTNSSDSPRKPDTTSKLGPNAQLQLENDNSFLQCILLDAPSASDLRVNVILAVHRHNRDTAGYVNVATINASIQSVAQGAK